MVIGERTVDLKGGCGGMRHRVANGSGEERVFVDGLNGQLGGGYLEGGVSLTVNSALEGIQCDSETDLEKGRVEVALQCDGGRRAKQLVEKDDDNTNKNEESSVGNWMQSMDASRSKDQSRKLTSFGHGE